MTGAAGFIGSHVAEKLLSEGNEVVGIDNFDAFYAREIKERNLAVCRSHHAFHFVEGDICDAELWSSLSSSHFDVIIHLAAKAGVRPSMQDPVGYNMVNVIGTTRVLEFARQNNIPKVVFASSSSVYGVNKNLPWSVDEPLLPISIYASTKLSSEQLCGLYQQHFGLKIVALRFFTVFGPRQRPDLAIHKFVKAIDKGARIQMYGTGQTFRDYTYIEDIVQGVLGAVHYCNTKFEIFNLGNTHTVSLSQLVEVIEEVMGKKAEIEYLPEQPGDVPYTWSNIEKSRSLLGYDPHTDIKTGIARFVEWYRGTN